MVTEAIRGTGGWITRLDAGGNPLGDRMRISDVAHVEFVSCPESEPLDLAPVDLAADGLKWMNLEVTFCTPNPLRLFAMLYGTRRFWGYTPKLAINGHEYRRRRHSR